MRLFEMVLNNTARKLNNETTSLLKMKPTGFAPIKKNLYRRKCRMQADRMTEAISAKKEYRIIGNTGTSKKYNMNLDSLNKSAKGGWI